MRIAGVLMAVAVFAGAARIQAAEEPDPLGATCARAGDRSEVTGDIHRTVVTLSSLRGIGEATLLRSGERWPETVILRLKLTGLEMLALDNGSQTLNVSVRSHGDHARSVDLVTAEGPPRALDPTLVRMFNPGGQATARLPEPGGWFELEVPRPLLAPASKTISVRWVDFYR